MTKTQGSRVYRMGPDTRIRKEADRYLLVNMATQGLHFITAPGYAVISSLDGQKTAAEIVTALWPQISEESQVAIYQLLEKLAERKILIATP
jgi:hypothetical protein